MAQPKLILAAAALAALGLSACNDQPRGGLAGGSAKLCTPFPGQTANGANAAAPAAPSDPASAVDDCLHRWGYALAASPDPADQVASATVAACSSLLARWNQQQGVAPNLPPGQEAAGVEAPSLVTGQTTTAAAEHFAYAQRRAQFYVVQGRAGKCSVPALPDTAATTTGGAPAL